MGSRTIINIAMRPFPKFLALFLISLFLAFSFNAYACLVPIYGGMQVSQGSDCTTPGEEPASQFCEGFKTLAVQSGPDSSSLGLSTLVLPGNISSLLPDPVTTRRECIVLGKTILGFWAIVEGGLGRRRG